MQSGVSGAKGIAEGIKDSSSNNKIKKYNRQYRNFGILEFYLIISLVLVAVLC